MIYELRDPVQYTAEKTCKAIEFKKPTYKQRTSSKDFIDALSGKDSDLIDPTVQLAIECGEIVGDGSFPISGDFFAHVSITDILGMAEVFGNFIFPPKDPADG